jgi:hypothetical protein
MVRRRVGIDGGYVRAAHKEGWFEVIVGKSIVAFQRDEQGEQPTSTCFGFVQTFDTKPRRRLWELLKIQGMQENPQVVSDGGETVRTLQAHCICCFLTKRLLTNWFTADSRRPR